MRKVTPEESWPQSWKESYQFDRLEIHGDLSYRGHAYAYAQRRRHTLELVQKMAPPGARILDPVVDLRLRFPWSGGQTRYNNSECRARC
jgi:hypothetical protein